MEQHLLSTIFKLIKEAGHLALEHIQDSAPTLKSDQSVVTKADHLISAHLRAGLSEFINLPGHILIDEEDEKRGQLLYQKALDENPFIWAIDPIDGTRLYANRMPHFGISVGILKNARPWLGVVYFPYLKELFYADGREAYFVQNAFSVNETKQLITPIKQTIDHQSIFLCHDFFSKNLEWDYKDCHLMMQSCAIVDFCWPSLGRGCGAITNSYLWDFTGSWPIARAAGLSLFNLKTGQELEAIKLDVFKVAPNPWKLNEYHILCHPENFKQLQSKIKMR